ncbi:MAG: transposase [Planctomycetota bacterium]
MKRLSEVELLSVSADAIDAHPLIREYFSLQLQRDQPEAFRAAHSRLFDYLCETTKPHRPDGLDGLAPLYEAVTHGCLAGRQQEACEKVYFDRILCGGGSDGFYSTKKLGAIGADLAAVAAFFESSPVAWASRPCSPSKGETPAPLSEPFTGGTPALRSGPWSQVSPNLTAADQAWLLNAAAFRLRALGRLTEALQPMRAGLEMRVQQKVWKSAAIIASNLSELEMTLGRLPDAVTDARQSITHADQSGDAFQRMVCRTTAADALHQSGQRAEAGTLFAEAERMQQERQPQFDLLYSLGGFRYCDWLLAPAEQAAWQHLSRSTGVSPLSPDSKRGTGVSPVAGGHGRDAHATEGFHIRQGANLPHWRQDGAIYAVTFRLADSVPKQVLEGWRIEREQLIQAAMQKSGQLSPAEADRLQVLFSEKVEAFLNQRQGACWMMRDDVAELVQNALLHFDGTRYDLFAWCVIPNHVHVVVRPRPEHSLESILHSWKSFTSRKIGQIVGKTGTIWQSEYYDHLIRDEDDLFHAMEYVLNNPQAAGLENWRWVGHRSTGVPPVAGRHGRDAHATALAEVERRATTVIKRRTGLPTYSLLNIALDHLTLARVGLIRAILANSLPQPTLDLPHVAAAVNGLRAAGTTHELPRGLLTASLYHFVRGEPALSQKHLAEAQQIAERGPMPLFLADIHLTRARLAGSWKSEGRSVKEGGASWNVDPKAELNQAAKLIHTLGYGLRYEELAVAEKALA